MKKVPQFIAGEFVQSQTQNWIDVTNPATNEVIAQVPCATADEMRKAIDNAGEVFKSWKETPVSERARVMLRYQALLKEHHDEIAEILSQETGKTFDDAKGDVWRGIEVVEHAANVASMMMGETVENVAREVDTHSWIQPLGVCAGITPFNFPAMIPLWMFPMAIACGNTFVLKPSEQDPLTPMRLAELFEEAGAPKGVLQVVHGAKEQVDTLLNDPAIKAISFVGSVPVGRYIYETGTRNMKRVQSFAGAKNHMVIMPDADPQQVVGSLMGAAYGSAGERCMAISVAVCVGDEVADNLVFRKATLYPATPLAGRPNFYASLTIELGKRYYYRAVATNALGTTKGAPKKFTTAGSPNRWWSDSSPQGKDWRTSAWFGTFRPYDNGWIYHAKLGWAYAHPDGSGGLWLWMKDHRWTWTQPGVLPYLWKHQSASWHYLLGIQNGQPVFYEWKQSASDKLP